MDNTLEQLRNLLKQKKSKAFYAERLGVSIEEVEDLLKELRNTPSNVPEDLRQYQLTPEECDTPTMTSFDENVKTGQATATFNVPTEVHNLEELIEQCKIDTEKWEITRYVQNYWGNGGNPHWQVKAWMSLKKADNIFQDKFMEFLAEYKPSSEVKKFACTDDLKPNPNACLVINKQDEHINKLDIYGNNDIDSRCKKVFDKVQTIIRQAQLSNTIDQIIYIIGSDEFNSEWNSATTKGTPQQNIHSYHGAFQMICDYETQMLNLLLTYCDNVHVKYVQGNHDEYVGWHLINWLQTYYRNESGLVFDTSTECTKYVKYDNTAMMFNHGDAIKPDKLAKMFPHGFKDQWSSCDHFYIFTGDKHHEESKDLGGIIFYQIPALSSARSSWDRKNGHEAKAELTVFLIEEEKGRTNIFKQPL